MTEEIANQAQSQLNRLRFLGKVLTVERANHPNSKNSTQTNQNQPVKDFSHASKIVLSEPNVNPKNLMSRSEPIAPRLAVDYPFPPHLEYQYPPPDGNILTNIVSALIAVPRFYTQVLHLMNKMNLPAPFRMALPTPPLPPPQVAMDPPPPPPPPADVAKPPLPDLSSDESEMESSDEDADGSNKRRKKVKREAIVGPAIDKEVAHESVGLKPATLVPKEVPIIKKKNPVLQIKIGSKLIQKEEELEKEKTDENKNENENKFAQKEEIERGKLPPEEILSLPMFKNYTPGNSASVLYIKNLAKDVVPDDFYFIFGSIFGSTDAARSGLTIKLMQEGRMRGQAFVTFPSTELAQHALNLVNGFVFKGKPMIIQFGRNPAAKKTD